MTVEPAFVGIMQGYRVDQQHRVTDPQRTRQSQLRGTAPTRNDSRHETTVRVCFSLLLW